MNSVGEQPALSGSNGNERAPFVTLDRAHLNEAQYFSITCLKHSVCLMLTTIHVISIKQVQWMRMKRGRQLETFTAQVCCKSFIAIMFYIHPLTLIPNYSHLNNFILSLSTCYSCFRVSSLSG